MKHIIAFFMIFTLMLSLGACQSYNNSSNTEDKVSDEQMVRDAVTARALMEYYGTSIGGNAITRSNASIASIRQGGEFTYYVSGKMRMTDKYGTIWENNFDCTVTSTNGENWSCSAFRYKNTNWTRTN